MTTALASTFALPRGKALTSWEVAALVGEIRVAAHVGRSLAAAHQETRQAFERARRAANSRYLYARAGFRLRRMFDRDYLKDVLL